MTLSISNHILMEIHIKLRHVDILALVMNLQMI